MRRTPPPCRHLRYGHPRYAFVSATPLISCTFTSGMSSHKVLCLFLLAVALSWPAEAAGVRARCEFPAIYMFGDSNSDTGGRSAAFSEVPPPNGETFFGRPSGRYCDGRLIIDFISEALKLPYSSPYLDSLGTNFRHGANFAIGGASIRPGGYTPIHLAIQISQFVRFKARSTALLSQKKASVISSLPNPLEFSKALYVIDIGQNDLSIGFQKTNPKQVRASIPDILSQYSDAVHELYREGARVFLVHNTGPIGCLPYSVIYDQSKPNNLDRNGCVRPENSVAREFNKQLKGKIVKLRTKLPEATFTYVDVYSAKYSLVSEAKKQGFVNPFTFCCGSYYGYHIDCGKKAIINGTEYGNPCGNPSKHVSWDGIHYTDAANRWISNRILNGSFSDPPIPIEEACLSPKQVTSKSGN